jgi:hypothetical protein
MKTINPINLAKLTVNDFLSPFFILLSIIPLIITIIVLVFLFGDMVDSVFSWINGVTEITSGNISVDSEEPIPNLVSDNWFLKWLFDFTAVKWLVLTFMYIGGFYFIIVLSLIITIFIIGLLTPLIINKIGVLHYPEVNIIGFGNLVGSNLKLIKTVFIMIFLFILFIPIYFIPILNVFAINAPLYYFYHTMILNDVGSTINTKIEFNIIIQETKPKLYGHTLILFVLALLPLAGLLLQGAFIIYLSHLFFIKTKELRAI